MCSCGFSKMENPLLFYFSIWLFQLFSDIYVLFKPNVELHIVELSDWYATTNTYSLERNFHISVLIRNIIITRPLFCGSWLKIVDIWKGFGSSDWIMSTLSGWLSCQTFVTIYRYRRSDLRPLTFWLLSFSLYHPTFSLPFVYNTI